MLKKMGKRAKKNAAIGGKATKNVFYNAQKEEKMGVAKVEKTYRRERQVRGKSTRKLQILREAFTSEKLQRCSKRPLPCTRQLPQSCAQLMQ